MSVDVSTIQPYPDNYGGSDEQDSISIYFARSKNTQGLRPLPNSNNQSLTFNSNNYYSGARQHRSPERLQHIMKCEAQGMLGSNSPFFLKNATQCEEIKEKNLAENLQRARD